MTVLRSLLNHHPFAGMNTLAQADLTSCLSTEVLSLCKLYSWCFRTTGGRLSLKSLRENSVMRFCKLERISAAPSAEHTPLFHYFRFTHLCMTSFNSETGPRFHRQRIMIVPE